MVGGGRQEMLIAPRSVKGKAVGVGVVAVGLSGWVWGFEVEFSGFGMAMYFPALIVDFVVAPVAYQH